MRVVTVEEAKIGDLVGFETPPDFDGRKCKSKKPLRFAGQAVDIKRRKDGSRSVFVAVLGYPFTFCLDVASAGWNHPIASPAE